MPQMTPEQRESAMEYLRKDFRVQQGEPITEAMWDEAIRNTVPKMSKERYVTPQEIEARAAHQKAVGIHELQTRQAAEERRREAMSEDEHDVEADLMLADYKKEKIRKATASRQWAAVERYEKELKEVEDGIAAKRLRIAALAERRTTDLALQEDPDFRYALTSAEINRDILDPYSADATENSVFINALKSATPENYKAVVRDFHQWESQRYARITQEKQAAEAAALQQADPAMRAMNQAAVDAAEAGLKSAEALGRAQRLRGPGDLSE